MTFDADKPEISWALSLPLPTEEAVDDEDTRRTFDDDPFPSVRLSWSLNAILDDSASALSTRLASWPDSPSPDASPVAIVITLERDDSLDAGDGAVEPSASPPEPVSASSRTRDASSVRSPELAMDGGRLGKDELTDVPPGRRLLDADEGERVRCGGRASEGVESCGGAGA